MARFIVRAIFAAFGLALAAYFLPGVSYDTTTTLILAAVLLGVVNAILRPILFFLTLGFNLVADYVSNKFKEVGSGTL